MKRNLDLNHLSVETDMSETTEDPNMVRLTMILLQSVKKLMVMYEIHMNSNKKKLMVPGKMHSSAMGICVRKGGSKPQARYNVSRSLLSKL